MMDILAPEVAEMESHVHSETRFHQHSASTILPDQGIESR